MPSYQLIIFDFDGTLADSGDWMIRTLNDIAGQFGLRRVTDEEVAMLRGRSNSEIVKYLHVPAWKLPGIMAEMRRRIARDLDKINLFAGVAELLRKLDERGFKLAIVSSNSEANVRHILGDQNALRIDTFECEASLFGKANKLRTVMKRIGIKPQATLCIGDETRDIEAARQVGAAAGAVFWGYAKPDVLLKFTPNHAFKELDDIAALAV